MGTRKRSLFNSDYDYYINPTQNATKKNFETNSSIDVRGYTMTLPYNQAVQNTHSFSKPNLELSEEHPKMRPLNINEPLISTTPILVFLN